MIRIGIVGVGTIGAELARQCLTRFSDDVRLVGIVDTDTVRERQIRKELGIKRRMILDGLIDKSDLVVEAASTAAAYPIAKKTLSMGRDVMIMSSGGLIGKESEIYNLTTRHRAFVHLPSGAVTGLDGLKSAGIGKIRRVELTTRKAPLGLRNAPYINRRRIDLNTIKEETLIFEGAAQKAIEGFPQNINISATLSLAGIGAKRTKVKIYACPGLAFHVHEVVVEGEFGSIYTRTLNVPSRMNPKTSQLAIYSAIATLKRIFGNVKIGT